MGALFLLLAATSEPFDVFNILQEQEEETVFTAGRAAQKASETTLTVEVITADEIAHSGVELLPELLRRYAGMDVTQTTLSDFSLSVRGDLSRTGTGDRVLLLIDGRPATNDAYGSVLWNNLPVPLELIERVEIVRGPGTAMYGGIGLTGVVNIITKQANARPAVYARLAGGSFLTSPGRRPWPAWGFRGGITAISDNTKHELSLSTSMYHVATLGELVQLRAPNTAVQAFYRYRMTETQHFKLSFYSAASARDAVLSTLERRPLYDNTTLGLVSLEYVVGPKHERDWGLTARTTFIGLPPLTPAVRSRLDGVLEVINIGWPSNMFNELFVTMPVLPNMRLTFGADARLFGLSGSVERGGTAMLDFSAFAIDELRVASWLVVEAAFRAGLRAYPLGGTPVRGLFSPRLGVALPLHQNHTLRASVALSQRPSSPLELFGIANVPTFLAGNPALLPETAVSVDLGYTFKSGPAEINISPFLIFYRDLRERAGDSLTNGAPYTGAGGELTGSLRPTEGVLIRANYSMALYWQNGQLAPSGAPHKANLMVDTELPLGFGLNAALGYVSKASYFGPLSTTYPVSIESVVADRMNADLSLRWEHGSGLGLQLSAQNVARVGPWLRAEYPATASVALGPRFMLAFSYTAQPAAAASTAWQQKWPAQLGWALGTLALFLAPNIVPFFF